MQKFEKTQNFKDDFSSQEGAKGIKFGVIRKLHLSATKHYSETFFMKLKWSGVIANRRKARKITYLSRIYTGSPL